MKLFHYALILAVLLAGVTSGTALAQGGSPDSITSITVSPDPVYVGANVTITLDYDNDLSIATHAAVCVYFRPAADLASWRANFPATVETFGAIYTLDASGYCPNISGYDDFYYLTTDPSAIVDGDALEFAVSVPAITAGTKYVGFRIYSGADCEDDANDGGADAPGGATCNTLGGNRNKSFTVNVSSTQYVGNTGCGTNIPCQTGVSGLQNAINALPAAGGTVYVYGSYLSGSVSLGAKDVVLRPVDATSALGDDDSCSGQLLLLDGAGDLTIDGLALDGSLGGTNCTEGVRLSGGSGQLTIQNSSSIKNWSSQGVVISSASGPHTFNNVTFTGNTTNAVACNAGSTTLAISNSTFSTNGNGVNLGGCAATVERNTFSSNTGDGVVVGTGSSVVVRGNTFTGNAGYGFNRTDGTLTAYANNLSGNNGGGFQALVNNEAAAAKNWWGSATNSAVGPTSGAGVYTAGWDRRLGADAVSWAAGTAGGTATLGSSSLAPAGGSGVPVIISFGRGSLNAPFGNGIPPFVNRTCSDYYDYYVVGGAGNWTIAMPVDVSTDCTNNVLYTELAYKITPGTYDGECSTSNNTMCWDRIPESAILVSGNTLLITQSAAELGYTHITAGDASGMDPTVVRLENLKAAPGQNAWLPVGLGALALVLGGTGIFLTRRRH